MTISFFDSRWGRSLAARIMDDAERNEVRQTLELEDGAAMAAAIERFTGAEQLHQFLANYNVNDGLLPCLAIARHPRCDRGTATWLYFQILRLPVSS